MKTALLTLIIFSLAVGILRAQNGTERAKPKKKSEPTKADDAGIQKVQIRALVTEEKKIKDPVIVKANGVATENNEFENQALAFCQKFQLDGTKPGEATLTLVRLEGKFAVTYFAAVGSSKLQDGPLEIYSDSTSKGFRAVFDKGASIPWQGGRGWTTVDTNNRYAITGMLLEPDLIDIVEMHRAPMALTAKSSNKEYLERVSILDGAGDFGRAMDDLAVVIKRDPKAKGAYLIRGNIELKMGDLEKAKSDFDECIKIDPKYGAAYLGRGEVHCLKGNWQEALADFRQADMAAPGTQLRIWLSRAHTGERTKADKDVATYLTEHYPRWRKTPLANLNITIMGYLIGKATEKQISDAATMVDAEEPKAECKAWYFAGLKHHLDSDKDKAEECFKNAVATDQKNFLFYKLAVSQLKNY